METLSERLQALHERIHLAAQRSGRHADEVELLAVSKTFPAEVIREAVDAGQILFGENRVQEALGKIPLLPSQLRWHLIGPLQTNKIRKILPHVEAVQSVSSLENACDINRIAAELGLYPRIYLEVNVGEEGSKHGFSVRQLPELLEELYALERLEIVGLMSVPPVVEEAEQARPYFVRLRKLRDELETRSGGLLPELSMGMSHDFEVAIEEGATLVRVGSALFGKR